MKIGMAAVNAQYQKQAQVRVTSRVDSSEPVEAPPPPPPPPPVDQVELSASAPPPPPAEEVPSEPPPPPSDHIDVTA